ncbi:MAG: flagellar biosynthetic protein FliR [Hyphomonas sp.]|nr:flagellar biosynthetic protein FliR [Hyphomonas sp.]MBU3921794.1 flagellar biosynthetic protein FliR [Alphaproteobacteria bacterium]MBU4062451.1 flagellar biosynthetic protein FliR [Alphaproteobacteria bacterium]MBU4165940.1 flagellar biosynthetic protein FliR [Alphaproteobacteria bacterium]
MALFMIVLARLSFVIFFMPGIGEQVIPARARAFVLIGVALAMTTSGFIAAPATTDITGLFGLLVTEIFIGFALGTMLRVTIWMLTIAGSVIAQSIGLSQFLAPALEHEAQTLTANLLSMAGAAVLLSANFHVEVIVSLLRLYTDIPLGALTLLSGPMLAQSFFSAFGFALLLAWPFVAINLLYNICLGFINKALPSLMVAFVGAPFMVGAGTMLLAVSVAGLLIAWKDRAMQLVGWM